jgi:hypothetical protein
MLEYIPCYSAPAVHWGLLPATRLAGRKILIEQNIKRRTGPALCVFSLLEYTRHIVHKYCVHWAWTSFCSVHFLYLPALYILYCVDGELTQELLQISTLTCYSVISITLRYVFALTHKTLTLLKRLIASIIFRSGHIAAIITSYSHCSKLIDQ